MVKDFRQKNWRPAQIIDKLSPVTYNVKLADDREWKRHIDQVRPCETTWNEPKLAPTTVISNETHEAAIPVPISQSFHEVTHPSVKESNVSETHDAVQNKSISIPTPKKVDILVNDKSTALRRSSRIRNQRKNLNL